MALHVANQLVLTNNGTHNGGYIAIDDHSVVLNSHDVHQTLFEKHPNMRVLFDLTHGEQLNVGFVEAESASADNGNSDSSQAESIQEVKTLKTFLEKVLPPGSVFDKHESETEKTLRDLINDYNILVLGGSTKPFTDQEIESIVEFVFNGGALLITGNHYSIVDQERDFQEGEGDINNLLKRFGLGMKELLSYPPDKISEFSTHYISSEVNNIILDEPCCLEVFPDTPEREVYTIASIPQTREPLVAGVQFKYGRVAAVADTSIFDRYLRFGQNEQIVLNIFRWLTINNLLECWGAKIASTTQKGKAESFSIKLRNPHPTRLEYIKCFLDTHSSSEIVGKNEQDLRSLPPYGEACLEWSLIPQQVGRQKLSLAISVAGQSEHAPMFFDSVAQFRCTSDIEIQITVLNNSEGIPEVLENGQSFEVKAVARHQVTDQKIDSPLELEAPGFAVDQVRKDLSQYTWKLKALSPGEWPITVRAGDVDQKRTRLVHVKKTERDNREHFESEIIPQVDSAIQNAIKIRLPELSMKNVKDIPIRLLAPEDFVRLLVAHDSQKHLMDVLKVARLESKRNAPLVNQLLTHLAPSYSPADGFCLAYDPEFARYLISINPEYADQISQCFLVVAGEPQSEMESNLSSLILHEKYGHGFFFSETTLGKQLALLYKYGLTRNVVLGEINQPYIRLLCQEYQSVIQALWDSALIVNEGFATWLELTLLPCLPNMSEYDAAKRKRALVESYDPVYQSAIDHSPYFKVFPPKSGSRYREGYEHLNHIATTYSQGLCTYDPLKAILDATNVDFGIFETSDQIRFSLSSGTLMKALLDTKDDYANATQRLRRIANDCSYSRLNV